MINRRLITIGGAIGMLLAGGAVWRLSGRSADLQEVRERVTPRLQAEYGAAGLTWGAPVFIRIFKQSRELELWVQNSASFTLFKTFPICSFSGDLGPKLAEGDRQSPEGFYRVAPAQMNPNSSYHLSFNLGFPNAYDRSHGRTGSYLMVHGDCLSIGCYAMTDAGIEEIYLAADAAHQGGQAAFDVHIFPFRMTEAAMARQSDHRWAEYWQNLRQGYDLFEADHRPPRVDNQAGRYVFS